ncbi:hypothetical protein RVO95_27745, partial [Klebsiella michiganensis]|nr:hypothetical protein [Klebsiella michiganensis]
IIAWLIAMGTSELLLWSYGYLHLISPVLYISLCIMFIYQRRKIHKNKDLNFYEKKNRVYANGHNVCSVYAGDAGHHCQYPFFHADLYRTLTLYDVSSDGMPPHFIGMDLRRESAARSVFIINLYEQDIQS